jgi:uncharacterized protein with PQ loop repeat
MFFAMTLYDFGILIQKINIFKTANNKTSDSPTILDHLLIGLACWHMS